MPRVGNETLNKQRKNITQTRSVGLFDGVLACQEYQAWYVMMYVLAGQYKELSILCALRSLFWKSPNGILSEPARKTCI